MAELVAWLTLLALAAVTERMLAARGMDPAEASAEGRLSDVIVQTTSVVAVMGPPLSATILGVRPGVVAACLGAALAASGLLLRGIAMQRLGRRYRLTPSRVPSVARVVVDGPYSLVRHPGYSGLLMFFVGLALLGGGAPGPLFATPLIGGTLVRIGIEERMLVAELGTAYQDYSKAVRWKLIPRIL